jgi:hypothetical protein
VLELAYVLTLGLDKISRELDEQRSLQSRLNQKDISLTEKNAWSFLNVSIVRVKGCQVSRATKTHVTC